MINFLARNPLCKKIDHMRKKHDSQTNSNAKLFQCGECDASFTISSNLLRHIRKQHHTKNCVRCFFCPTCFPADHNEVFHVETKAPHSNTIDSSSLLELMIKAINSKFLTHCVKSERARALQPFNCLFSHKDQIKGFVNNLMKN